MTIHQEVKKISDYLYLIVPGACPESRQMTCEDCAHSKIDFKASGFSCASQIKIAYVSCTAAKADCPEPGGHA